MVDVWILPPDSVLGIRCTLCTPLSYFILEYAPSPVIMNTASLNPPIPFSLTLISSTFHLNWSTYFWYILYTSYANRAASSPPAPARISTITFLESLGSFGSRRILSSCSMVSRFAFASFISSFAISRSSSSLSSSRISRLSSMVVFASLYSWYFSTIGERSLCSFMSFLNLF